MPVTVINQAQMFSPGPTLEVVAPDGLKYKIRETNGNDEDILSKISANKDGTSLHNFLAAVIVEPQLSADDVAKLKVRTKYYLLLKVRIFSHGSTIAFDHTYSDGSKYSYTENLNVYDFDLSTGSPPKKGEKGYDKRVIQPYGDAADYFEFTTSRGKTCRMKYLTGKDEANSMSKNVDDLSINDKLRMREFQLKMGDGAYQVIGNFSAFSSKEMVELRNKLEEVDGEFMMICELRHPTKNFIEEVSLFGEPAFFYPQV